MFVPSPYTNTSDETLKHLETKSYISGEGMSLPYKSPVVKIHVFTILYLFKLKIDF